MFLLVSTSKEIGYLFFSLENQLDEISAQCISLLINQLGSALEISKIYQEEKEKVDTDLLTKAKSREYLFKYLEKQIYNYEIYEQKFCLLFFDIDNFKNFNDTYGHDLGDEVLKVVVKLIKKIVEKKGIIARYGGEEFIVVFQNLSLKKSYYLAEEIRESIETYPIKEEFSINHNITVSIGLSEYTENSSTYKMIKEADESMYYAKKHGKNQVFLYKALQIINENK